MTPENRQLSIFEPQFDDRIRRIQENGVTYFSVLDTFQHYGNSSNPTMAWKTALKHLEKQGFDRSKEILDRVPANGGRPTPYAALKAFLRIAQVAEIAEWETIRSWMAEVAHERIEEMSNPELGEQRARQRSLQTYQRMGKDDTFIQKRLKSFDKRNDYTAVAQETHLTNKPNYLQLTNITYKGVFGMVKAEMVKAIGLTEDQAKKFRDHLNSLAIDAISTAESAASMKMALSGKNSLTDEEQIEITLECARRVAPSFWSVAEYLGVDLVTGQKLITS